MSELWNILISFQLQINSCTGNRGDKGGSISIYFFHFHIATMTLIGRRWPYLSLQSRSDASGASLPTYYPSPGCDADVWEEKNILPIWYVVRMFPCISLMVISNVNIKTCRGEGLMCFLSWIIGNIHHCFNVIDYLHLYLHLTEQKQEVYSTSLLNDCFQMLLQTVNS